MALSRFINFNILVSNSGLPREGFGLPGIVSHKNLWSGKSRQYSRTADMVTDGFAEDSPEVLCAGAMFAQQPPPPFVDILKAITVVTLQYTVDCTAEAFGEYEIDVDGEGVTSTACTYQASSVVTPAMIHSALLTQLNAVAGKNYLAAFAALDIADKTFTANDTSMEFTSDGHGYVTGDGPVNVSNSGGALPTGLAAATNYWMIVIDDNTFKLATTLANALAGTNLAISSAGTGTQTVSSIGATVSPTLAFTVTASSDNAWFSLTINDLDLVGILMTHADPGIASDLDAIIKKDNTWYWLVTLYNSKAYTLAAAAWVEENKKAYTPAIPDTSAGTTSVTDATDVMAVLLGLEYTRTEYKYHHSPVQFFDGGYVGLLSTKAPGLWTGKGKTIVGVSPSPLTDTHEANLDARKANAYTTEGPKNVTWEGRVANPNYGFLDVTVGLDWVANAVVLAAYGYTTSVDKVGYDDADIAGVESAINGVILEAVSPAHKIMAAGTPGDPNDPQPSISFPLVATIPAATRALRELPDGQLSFRYLGAVHLIDITATVTF